MKPYNLTRSIFSLFSWISLVFCSICLVFLATCCCRTLISSAYSACSFPGPSYRRSCRHLLHGFGDDTGDFVTGHGTATFKGAVAHAFDDAFFGQVIQGFIRPVVFGDIGETVGRCRQSRARHAQAQGQQDGKAFLVEFHHKDLFSINYLPAWPLRCHRLCVPVPGWPDGPWRRCSRDSPESWAGR